MLPGCSLSARPGRHAATAPRRRERHGSKLTAACGSPRQSMVFKFTNDNTLEVGINADKK
eukprot:6179418-Pleurochrysis_carterae.AAC.5